MGKAKGDKLASIGLGGLGTRGGDQKKGRVLSNWWDIRLKFLSDTFPYTSSPRVFKVLP